MSGLSISTAVLSLYRRERVHSLPDRAHTHLKMGYTRWRTHSQREDKAHMKLTEPTEAQAQLIAWTPPERIEGPDGERITAGAQPIIDYHDAIKVSKIHDA